MKKLWSLAGSSLIHHDDLQLITGLVSNLCKSLKR